MNLGGFLDQKAQQPLPSALIDYESELYAFQKSCQTLMNEILDLFAIGLEVRSYIPDPPFLGHFYSVTANTTRYLLQPKDQNGSPIATAQNQHLAPSASCTTPHSHQTSKSNPKSTSELELTQTTALSPCYFNGPANLGWKSFLRPLLPLPMQTTGRQSRSSRQEQNPTHPHQS